MPTLAATPQPANVTRKNPFMAELIEHRMLTRTGSEKDTRHFVLSIAGSGISYNPGDALGAFANNAAPLVDELITLLNFDALSPVANPEGQEVTLRQALTHNYILNRATRKFLLGLSKNISSGQQHEQLSAILQNDEAINEYLFTRDYCDILLEYNEVRFESPKDFLNLLSPVTPRLYSIASSLEAHPDEVHLCIAVVRYETHGRQKAGFCSGFFADHSAVHVNNIPVYVQPSRHFRLPQDPATDIIMCGNGTGIAPYRAFVQQRVLEGASGRNWLVFGEQRQATDFLYGNEWRRYHQEGKLHRLNLAFSRDQQEKIYVQHRLKENARELWDWLQKGAYFYVCGDAKRMAKDVHQTMIEIAQEQGGMSRDAAEEYVNQTLMKTERRYLRDVY